MNDVTSWIFAVYTNLPLASYMLTECIGSSVAVMCTLSFAGLGKILKSE
jgi:hypothetical protein